MRRRVCLVTSTTAVEPGGMLAARLRGLRAAGWDARLFCKGRRYVEDPALDGEHIERSSRKGRRLPPLALIRNPAWPRRYLRAPGEPDVFDRRLIALRPDLIHFHSGVAAWKGMRLRRLLGCRMVVSFRGDGRDLQVPDRGVLWEADLLLFPDAASLQRATLLGCPPERAEVLAHPPWVDGRVRKPRAAGSRVRILSAAPLIWEQGFEHALDAVARLVERGFDCRYRLVGTGPHEVAVAFARHQLGLHERVELIASASLVDELCESDVFVDPSVSDTTSITPAATAQALGVPVVATPRPELAAAGALLVPRRNADAIARALATLACEPALRERIGATARAQAPSADAGASRLAQLYERVLG